MTAVQERRLAKLRELARDANRAELRLERALRAARAKGDSLRALEAATGIPRVTLHRRLDGSSDAAQ